MLQLLKSSEARRLGLHGRHAYTITKVVEFDQDGRKIRLVRIRNPHGNHNEWKGDWSDG